MKTDTTYRNGNYSIEVFRYYAIMKYNKFIKATYSTWSKLQTSCIHQLIYHFISSVQNSRLFITFRILFIFAMFSPSFLLFSCFFVDFPSTSFFFSSSSFLYCHLRSFSSTCSWTSFLHFFFFNLHLFSIFTFLHSLVLLRGPPFYIFFLRQTCWRVKESILLFMAASGTLCEP